jgi:hypothetical protein
MKRSLLLTTVIMVVVLVVALSTATYAWFTVSGTVSTETVQFTAVTTTNLEISLAPDDGYSNKVTMVWNPPEDGIWPVSLEVVEPAQAGAPGWVFTEENEPGEGVTITVSNQYLMEELYLRCSGDLNVSLGGASFIVPNQTGSNMNGDIDRDLLVGSVRLAIFDENNELLFVWAPNANIKLTEAEGGYIIVTDDAENTNTPHTSYDGDSFLSQAGTGLGTARPLISLAAGVYQKITVFVWIEGTDPECHNVLTGGQFNVALTFVGT